MPDSRNTWRVGIARRIETNPTGAFSRLGRLSSSTVANNVRGDAEHCGCYDYSKTVAWPLLKQIAPRVTRAAVLRDPDQFAGVAQFATIQAVAPSLRVELTPIDVRDTATTERSVAAFARAANGGLVVLTSFATAIHLEAIVSLAAQLHLPAVYPTRDFVADGGLLSYGPDLSDQYRRAADYVDRILKGEKASDLPVHAPTKYELVLNLKIAKALELTVPQSILLSADEVIQ